MTLQIDALTKHGIPKSQIFMDNLSGAKSDRPGLAKCLDSLQSGDIPVVWRLDRLGRSMRHLITLVEDLRSCGVGFRSLNEGAIDTTSASGELIFNIFSALAQFERRLIQERTKAGLAAARARGRRGGRPPLDADQAKVLATRKLHGDTSIFPGPGVVEGTDEVSIVILFRPLTLASDYVARMNRHSLLRYLDPLLGKKKWDRPLMQLSAGCFFFPSRVEQRFGEVASAGQEAGLGWRVTRESFGRIRCAVFSAQA